MIHSLTLEYSGIDPILKLSVLYIYPCGSFGGDTRSLQEMLQASHSGSDQPYIVSQHGNVVDLMRRDDALVLTTWSAVHTRQTDSESNVNNKKQR